MSLSPRFRGLPARMSLTVGAAVVLAGGLPAAALAHHSHGHGHGHGRHARVLYVAPGGHDAGPCTRHRPCRTINHAVSVAHPGATVVVRAGTYAESVTVRKRLRLLGRRHPVVNAADQVNGIVLSGPASARSVVRGFVVEHADQEGILAVQTNHVTISHNRVRQNDLGAAKQPLTGECAPQGQVPGDCGEGVHLMSVRHARVRHNTVTANAGGILLSDELGPTTHNRIERNHVFANAYDCGITVAGHNPQAFTDGHTNPHTAGIYRNRIVGNVSNRNGLKGEGAGILLATAGPGTAVYRNLVRGNVANGNELSGITLHSHAPGDDLNGNRLIRNRVRLDNVGGDPDAGDGDTTGILIFSAVTELKGTVVRHNLIRDVHFGIWTQHVPPIAESANHFVHVDTPLSQH